MVLCTWPRNKTAAVVALRCARADLYLLAADSKTAIRAAVQVPRKSTSMKNESKAKRGAEIFTHVHPQSKRNPSIYIAGDIECGVFKLSSPVENMCIASTQTLAATS